MRSVLPQFDPLLKVNDSRASCGSLLCSLKFAIVDSRYCFLWREKTPPSIHFWLSMPSPTLLDSFSDLLMIQMLF